LEGGVDAEGETDSESEEQDSKKIRKSRLDIIVVSQVGLLESIEHEEMGNDLAGATGLITKSHTVNWFHSHL
jgi:hypothetical protein